MEDIERAMRFIKILSSSIVVLALSLGACEYCNEFLGLKDDNIIEILVEDMIESQLGLEIDLTPESPDEKNFELDMWKDD